MNPRRLLPMLLWLTYARTRPLVFQARPGAYASDSSVRPAYSGRSTTRPTYESVSRYRPNR